MHGTCSVLGIGPKLNNNTHRDPRGKAMGINSYITETVFMRGVIFFLEHMETRHIFTLNAKTRDWLNN